MRITLKEIAEKTGLSVPALSRVASGRGYVSAEVRKKAEAALQEYGYIRRRPRQAAAKMNNVILVITGSTGNVYEEIIRPLSEDARRQGKKVVVMHSNYESRVEEDALRFAQQANVYGVIMLSAVETRAMARLIRESPCPVVMLFRYMPMTQTDVVIQDNYDMGFQAARLFAQAGHTRMGYLGGMAESSITQDKQQGYTEELEELGLSLNPAWVDYGKLNYESGLEYGEKLLAMEEAPTALFISNDLMAMGVADALLRAGVRIPEELSLLCCDKTLASDSYHLPLSRFYVHYGDFAAAALQLLISRHENPGKPRANIAFDTHFIPGKTLAAPRSTKALGRKETE